MFVELLVAILFGVFCGVITGLTPGIHVNLVALLLFSSTSLLGVLFGPLSIAVVIVSCALTHSFLDFIPSIFLGAPDADTALGVLPGHKMLLEGRAQEAITLTVIGSLTALIVAVLLVPVLIPIVPTLYELLQPFIAYLLIIVVLFLILRDTNPYFAASVFILAGVLGLVVLNNQTIKQPLFPLLSGLFGISTLLISLNDNVSIPKQKNTKPKLEKKVYAKAIGSATLAGSLVSFFPGLGSAQAAVIGEQISGKLGGEGFLVMVGGINTVNFIISLVTLYTLEKARNGAVLVVNNLLTIDFTSLLVLLFSIMIAGGIAVFLAFYLSKKFSKLVQIVNYQKLVISIITLIIILSFVFSGLIGLLVLITATAVGILPAKLNVSRSHSMACLIVPVIIYFLL